MKIQAQGVYRVATVQGYEGLRDALGGWTINFGASGLAQLIHPPSVFCMVVRD